MKVIVTIDGTRETRLEGDASIFGNSIDYKKGFDSRLRDIGFWLRDWRYAGHSGPKQKRVFVPWGSCLMVEQLEEEKKGVERWQL